MGSRYRQQQTRVRTFSIWDAMQSPDGHSTSLMRRQTRNDANRNQKPPCERGRATHRNMAHEEAVRALHAAHGHRIPERTGCHVPVLNQADVHLAQPDGTENSGFLDAAAIDHAAKKFLENRIRCRDRKRAIRAALEIQRPRLFTDQTKLTDC